MGIKHISNIKLKSTATNKNSNTVNHISYFLSRGAMDYGKINESLIINFPPLKDFLQGKLRILPREPQNDKELAQSIYETLRIDNLSGNQYVITLGRKNKNSGLFYLTKKKSTKRYTKSNTHAEVKIIRGKYELNGTDLKLQLDRLEESCIDRLIIKDDSGKSHRIIIHSDWETTAKNHMRNRGWIKAGFSVSDGPDDYLIWNVDNHNNTKFLDDNYDQNFKPFKKTKQSLNKELKRKMEIYPGTTQDKLLFPFRIPEILKDLNSISPDYEIILKEYIKNGKSTIIYQGSVGDYDSKKHPIKQGSEYNMKIKKLTEKAICKIMLEKEFKGSLDMYKDLRKSGIEKELACQLSGTLSLKEYMDDF